MGSFIGFIIWVGVMAAIWAVAAKGKKVSSRQVFVDSPEEEEDGETQLPPEILELLEEYGGKGARPPAPVPPLGAQLIQKNTPKKAVLKLQSTDLHEGESYAAPIPAPYASPLVKSATPAQIHADAHIGPVGVKDNLKQHGPSATAQHADEHIATTPAVPTPQSAAVRKSPLASWIPRGEVGLRKALVMSEILGAPKSMR